MNISCRTQHASVTLAYLVSILATLAFGTSEHTPAATIAFVAIVAVPYWVHAYVDNARIARAEIAERAYKVRAAALATARVQARAQDARKARREHERKYKGAVLSQYDKLARQRRENLEFSGRQFD